VGLVVTRTDGGGDDAVAATEAGIQATVGVVAHEQEIETPWLPV
jgi:hypothetical protein